MLERKYALPILVLAMVLLAFAITYNHYGDAHSAYEDTPQANEAVLSMPDAITMSFDYPVASDLRQMIEGSQYIVVGEYTKFDSAWNMARNPSDITEEDPDNYTEGLIYDFSVEKVLKGNMDDESIRVNHRHFETIKLTESDAEVNGSGIIVKPATVTNEVAVEVADPTFIEPELNCKYILFLCKDKNFGNYYAAIEPFSIKLEDGVAVLQSNLTGDNNPFRQRVTASNSKQVDVSFFGAVSITDRISGMSYDELIGKIAE